MFVWKTIQFVICNLSFALTLRKLEKKNKCERGIRYSARLPYPKRRCFVQTFPGVSPGFTVNVQVSLEMIVAGEKQVLGENAISLLLSAPKSSHRLVWDRTGASALRDRRLSAWAMARPSETEDRRSGILKSNFCYHKTLQWPTS
jgi:hypothetical protein